MGIASVTEYYLGITFNLNGSFSISKQLSVEKKKEDQHLVQTPSWN